MATARPVQRLALHDMPTSSEFLDLAKAVRLWVIQYHDDEAAAFAASVVPIWTMRDANPEMKRAGRCPGCRFLGLWAKKWTGYTDEEHGHIWLFEEGIREEARRKGISLSDQLADTLIHELDHALERDHVLEHMRRAQATGQWPEEFRARREVGRARVSAADEQLLDDYWSSGNCGCGNHG